MIRQAIIATCVAASLAGCSSAPMPWESKVATAPPPLRPTSQPDPQLPDAKAILERESSGFFDPTANAKNIAMSSIFPTQTAVGVLFGVCVRASVTNRNGHDMGTVFYVATFQHDHIFDRRRAEPADGCEKESYDVALQFQPAAVAEAAKGARPPKPARVPR